MGNLRGKEISNEDCKKILKELESNKGKSIKDYGKEYEIFMKECLNIAKRNV